MTAGLYLVSILLLMLIAWMILSQRSRRFELVRRTIIERDTAMISTLFIGAQSEEIDDVLGRAVGHIGRGSQFDRVTLIRVGQAHLHRWTRVLDEPCPPNLERLLLDVIGEAEDSAAIMGQQEAAEGLIEIRSLSRAPGHATRLLAATGACSWAGFVFRRDGLVLGILCFETTSSRTSWPTEGYAAFWPLARVFEQALDRERIIAESRALQERLAQAQRLEAAGALASGIAHNFNNIVGAVLGHAELAAEAIRRGDLPSDHIDEIRRAAERASNLVESMLNLGRRNLMSGILDLGKLVAETVSLIRASLPHGIDVEVDVTPGPIVVRGRAGELQQIVLNLVRNAAQACGETGRIDLGLTRSVIHDSQIMQIGQLSRGDHLRLSVSDDGIGMDASTLDRIFEPFFTTRPAGTGLGLATVADIIREHGGAGQVVSTRGCGTTFHVWLPCATSPTENASVRGDGQVVLLLVDGDQDRLYKLEDMVAALGYEPAGHSSLATTLRLLHDGAAIDAILIDATGTRRNSGVQAAIILAKAQVDTLTLVLSDSDDLLRLPPATRAEVHMFDFETGGSSLARALSRVPRAV